jgi:hypothetical protein
MHTDKDISESSKPLSKLVNLCLVHLDLLPLCILGAALLFSMEAQVLQQDDLTTGRFVDSILNLFSNTIICENDLLAQQLLQFRHHGLQAILLVDLAVRTAEVGHEDDRLGAVVNGIFDSWQSSGDTLVVCDFLVRVEGDVEVDLAVLSVCSAW